VVNRFVAQAVTGVPLTVHGTGSATTGLIHLKDTISALAQWIEHPAARGEHRVINQANETKISIGRLAEMVQEAGRERGLNVELSFEHDPRHEAKVTTTSGPARNDTLRNSGIQMVPLHDGLRMLMDAVSVHADTLPTAAIQPNVDWMTGGGIKDAPPERRKATRPVVFARA
jgi:UDP-sulfoquinovose synthase